MNFYILIFIFILICFEYLKIKLKIKSLLNIKKISKENLFDIIGNKKTAEKAVIEKLYIYLSDKKGETAVFSIGNSIKNSVYIPEIYLNKFSSEEIKTILLHEEYHLKKNNYIKAKFFYNLFLISSFIIILSLKKITVLVLLIFFINNIIIKIVINIYLKRCEYRADNYAALFSGNFKSTISALEKMDREDEKFENILTRIMKQHPSTIKRIEKLKRSSYVKKRAVN